MTQAAEAQRQPMFEHVRELRKRLFISAAIIAVFGALGYMFHEYLLLVLQKPLGQTLYFTSPTGGFSFVFKTCFFFGVLVALPVIIYHICRFLGPVVSTASKKLFVSVVFWSVILAAGGVTFAYFISLPAALNFLTNFGGPNIESLITADEYFNFAITYIVGFALLFQLPLIILFINRIKPLPPKKLMKMQRYIVIFSFIAAAILTPTPDPFNQLLMAAPAILLYQLAVVMVIMINSRITRKRRKLEKIEAKTAAQVHTVRREPVKLSQLQPVPLLAQAAIPARPQPRKPALVGDMVHRPVARPAQRQMPQPARPAQRPEPAFHAPTPRLMPSMAMSGMSPMRSPKAFDIF